MADETTGWDNLDTNIHYQEIKNYYSTDSIWEIAKIAQKENRHTEFLRWFFDPENTQSTKAKRTLDTLHHTYDYEQVLLFLKSLLWTMNKNYKVTEDIEGIRRDNINPLFKANSADCCKCNEPDNVIKRLKQVCHINSIITNVEVDSQVSENLTDDAIKDFIKKANIELLCKVIKDCVEKEKGNLTDDAIKDFIKNANEDLTDKVIEDCVKKANENWTDEVIEKCVNNFKEKTRITLQNSDKSQNLKARPDLIIKVTYKNKGRVKHLLPIVIENKIEANETTKNFKIGDKGEYQKLGQTVYYERTFTKDWFKPRRDVKDKNIDEPIYVFWNANSDVELMNKERKGLCQSDKFIIYNYQTFAAKVLENLSTTDMNNAYKIIDYIRCLAYSNQRSKYPILANPKSMIYHSWELFKDKNLRDIIINCAKSDKPKEATTVFLIVSNWLDSYRIQKEYNPDININADKETWNNIVSAYKNARSKVVQPTKIKITINKKTSEGTFSRVSEAVHFVWNTLWDNGTKNIQDSISKEWKAYNELLSTKADREDYIKNKNNKREEEAQKEGTEPKEYTESSYSAHDRDETIMCNINFTTIEKFVTKINKVIKESEQLINTYNGVTIEIEDSVTDETNTSTTDSNSIGASSTTDQTDS